MAKKQRGRPSAAAQRGVFTRSQSEVFVRRTRSGLLRADFRLGRRHCNHISVLSAYTSDESRCVSTGIKDLRLRRVFSPASITIDSSPYQEDGGKSCEDRMDGAGELMDENIHEENGGVELDEGSFGSICGSGGARECGHPVNLNDTERDEEITDRPKMGDLCDEQPAVPAVESSYATSDIMFGEIPNVLDESKDEQVQCTPTDCVNAAEMEEDNVDGSKVMNFCSERAASMNPMTTETNFLPKSQPVVKPRRRSKLFGNPNSFSYRRLLPIFMELVKDNSNDVQILPCQSLPENVKKTSEDVSTLSNSLHCEQPPPQGCREKESRESFNVDVSKNEESNCKVIEYSSRSPMKCSKGEVHGDTVSKNESSSARELTLIEVKSDSSDEDLDADPVPDLLCKSSHFTSNISEALSVEEMAGNAQGRSYLPIKDEGPQSNMVHASKIVKPFFGTSETLSFYSKDESVLRPKKGILKKQTRGCKGICMCLDCVSFRIHADRAFEFSRKQMLEADEIIEGLVKELADLRNQVEKSTQPVNESGIFHPIFQFNQELLKGACRRSSLVEEVANKRRREMFNDLNAHCRIPGPRTTFAEAIDKSNN